MNIEIFAFFANPQDMEVEEERGNFLKIISEDTHPDFCSEFCQICADLEGWIFNCECPVVSL